MHERRRTLLHPVRDDHNLAKRLLAELQFAVTIPRPGVTRLPFRGEYEASSLLELHHAV